MTASVARAMMVLAEACLGAERQEWAVAMQVEFAAAVEDGRPLAFASGCLIAAMREMVCASEGRLVLANYGLALGLLIPTAGRQFERAADFFMFPSAGLLQVGAAHNPYLVWSQNSAALVLLLLWLFLGVAHLGLAWMLVEGNWPRVVKFGALIGATTVTLLLFAAVLMFELAPLGTHMCDLGLEVMALVVTARWRASLTSHATGDPFTS